jgi:hypothetical protein
MPYTTSRKQQDTPVQSISGLYNMDLSILASTNNMSVNDYIEFPTLSAAASVCTINMP